MKNPDELLNKHAKIQPNELRVGNWLKGIGHNIIWKIEGVHEDFIFSKNAWRILSSFEPIPLTEEWLIKFGFLYVPSEGDFMFKNQNDRFEIQPYKDGFSNYVLWDSNEIIEKCKYIHQLQNLYFALTNEELIYTP